MHTEILGEVGKRIMKLWQVDRIPYVRIQIAHPFLTSARLVLQPKKKKRTALDCLINRPSDCSRYSQY